MCWPRPHQVKTRSTNAAVLWVPPQVLLWFFFSCSDARACEILDWSEQCAITFSSGVHSSNLSVHRLWIARKKPCA